MNNKKNTYPFSAIVGQDEMKKGLLLNAVNPKLSGILIRGEKGTAKSTAVRALAEVLPEIFVVSDCPFSCDPDDVTTMCTKCRQRVENGEILPRVKRKMKVIDLPVSATEDMVIGTLDMEKAIKKGEKHFEPGLLAKANRSILYVDEVNLLDDHIVDVLLDSAAMGVNTVEREGVSFTHPANFILVGTMNPEEGELRPQLLDRFGFCVNITGISDANLRVEVIKRRAGFDKNPQEFADRWEEKQDDIRKRIILAKDMLKKVRITDKILYLIANISIELGVDGHRADLIMMKSAKTIAAFNGREEVTEEEIRQSVDLVLLHRMRRKPFEELGVDENKLEEILTDSVHVHEHTHAHDHVHSHTHSHM